ncbi:hypothetical protein GJ688_18670 [Heliobacillus mobilis]|uniref:Uncharacterized protein n=1 Tax=Heliobacterium mobile TaxID=28064 RepID=A0A6I3SPF9_HELMO|nr:hypothetical protein [Heliobacterium mobile]MTV50943.1 hypothetical protein [Heliobacterium mobile]
MKRSIFSTMAIILPVYLFLTVLWPGGPGQQYLLMVMIVVLVGSALYQSWPFVRERFWGTNSTTIITPSMDDEKEPTTLTMGMTIRPWIASFFLLLFGWWWDMLLYYGIVAAVNLVIAIYILVQSRRLRRHII